MRRSTAVGSRQITQVTLTACVLLGFQTGSLLAQNRNRQNLASAVPESRPIQLLTQLDESLEEISRRCGRAVVEIRSRIFQHSDSETGGMQLTARNSSGSGIILSADGYILTNAHVVRGSHSLKVHLDIAVAPDESGQKRREEIDKALPATVIGIDSRTDLALIKVDATQLPFISLGDSDQLRQGQLVLALGNPFGLDHSVTLGVVSAVSRQLKNDDALFYIQTDAPINPGNSGGPLVDTDGQVVGINTFMLSESGGSEGVGFAIPSNIAQLVYQQLRRDGSVHRAKLGLTAQTINGTLAAGLDLEIDHGVIVSDVEPVSPAAEAGIKSDDVIIAADGKKLRNAGELGAAVYRRQPGEQIVLRVRRGDEDVDIPVILNEHVSEEFGTLQELVDTLDPTKNSVAQLGIIGVDLSAPVLKMMSDLRRPEGVVVAALSQDDKQQSAEASLRVGDVIYEVNRKVVRNVAELRSLIGNLNSGDAAAVLVERDGHLTYVPIELN